MRGVDFKFPVKLTGDTTIEYVLNEASKSLLTPHLLFAPDSFKRQDTKRATVFYQLCLYSIYVEALMPKLRGWQRLIDEYFNDFVGSWEYYAAYKRINLINEFGGEEGDYDKDGNVTTVVGEKELIRYSVLNDLVCDCVDIVQDTTVKDMSDIITYMQIDAHMSMDDMTKAVFGKTLSSYKLDKNGNMVEVTWAEKQLNKASKADRAHQLGSCLILIVGTVHRIVERMRKLKKDRNNRKPLSDIRADIDNLIAFNPNELKKYLKTPTHGKE